MKRRLTLVGIAVAVLLALGALVTAVHGPGGYGLFGQPKIERVATGNIPLFNPPATPAPAKHKTKPNPTPPVVSYPCIQPGATTDDNANVPFRSPSHPSPLFKQAPDDFGPPPGTGPNDLIGAKVELKFRLCGGGGSHGLGVGPDQRLFAALWTMVNGGNPNTVMSNGTWVREVNQFVGHDIQWSQASLVYKTFTSPQTELMIPGQFPKIYRVQGTVHHDVFLYLPVRAKNGQIKILWLRRACGYQPYGSSATDFPSAVPVAY